MAITILFFVKKSVFESAFQKVLLQCSLFQRLMNFINGMFDLTTIVYYLSIIFLFLFFHGTGNGKTEVELNEEKDIKDRTLQHCNVNYRSGGCDRN